MKLDRKVLVTVKAMIDIKYKYKYYLTTNASVTLNFKPYKL
jgi:hypothetical protein